MEMTQKDYDERKARVDAGAGDDEDQRLVGLYESAGYKAKDAGPELEAGDLPADGTSTSHATQPGEVKPTKATGSAQGRRGGRGEQHNESDNA